MITSTFRTIPLLLLAAAAPLFGLGCEGHQMVALIAAKHLTPAALEAVNQLLSAQPIDPGLSRYCQERPKELMADASTWADDIKKQEKTGPWHYIDIPRGVEHANVSRYCEPVGPSQNGKDRPGCILTAMTHEWTLLRDVNAPAPARADALRYLIHFMGDLHQPLHDTDNNDQGGNCVPLRFFAEEKPSNLHAAWDYKILEHNLRARRETVAAFAAELDTRYLAKWSSWGEESIDFERWAWEGHRIAEKTAYGKLRPAVPIETPGPKGDCAAETNKLTPLHLELGEAYQQTAAPILERQIAKAGYRLADLLNRTFH